MPTSFLPYEPKQDFLLPPSLAEWLPENHLVYFVSEIIDRLDLQIFYARYEGDGRRNQPYDPAMLVKVLLYGYATGVFSSRKMARKLFEDIAFRILGAGNFPSHRPVCDFRLRHLPELKELFVQVAVLARELGMVKLGTIALDGTKIKANASKHKAMSYGRMKEQEQKLKGKWKRAAVLRTILKDGLHGATSPSTSRRKSWMAGSNTSAKFYRNTVKLPTVPRLTAAAATVFRFISMIPTATTWKSWLTIPIAKVLSKRMPNTAVFSAAPRAKTTPGQMKRRKDTTAGRR
jgi:transposase